MDKLSEYPHKLETFALYEQDEFYEMLDHAANKFYEFQNTTTANMWPDSSKPQA